ncbi:hypothetical protein [Acholeplasma equifetale]|uniref:hypothetical protein n=1 Tax=Acholeplasma equifetale TaxID=264634 RepID=UPI00047E86A7|nr:hypothetical protein [Acholeplasma equifetale]
MKKILVVITLLMGVFLVSCEESNSKEFSKSGITITLTDDFYEKEIIAAPFYLESQDNIFMGNREDKSLFSSMMTLERYTTLVLGQAEKTTDIEKYLDDNIEYYYAYYEATVDGRTFGYMLVTLESETHFYLINFACLKSKLEGNKDLYHSWARSIKVE